MWFVAAGTSPCPSLKVVKVNTGNEKLRRCHLNVLDSRYYSKAKNDIARWKNKVHLCNWSCKNNTKISCLFKPIEKSLDIVENQRH